MKLDALPSEILYIIFEYLTIDTTKYAYPSQLDQIVLDTKGLYFTKVLKEKYMPLMLVNQFFHHFVKSVVFTNFYMGNDITHYTTASEISVDKNPFVFTKNCFLDHLSTKLPNPIYEIPLQLYNESLLFTKRLWLVDGAFDFSCLLGNQWNKGIVDKNIHQLVYLAFDIAVCNDYLVTTRFQSIPESVEDCKDLPSLVITRLTNPDEPIETRTQIYNQQLLFNSLAKLISHQKEKITCKVISHNQSIFELSCLLWAFEKEQALDSIKTLDIKYAETDKYIAQFAKNLANLTSLQNLSLVNIDPNKLLSSYDVQLILTGIKNLSSLQQLHLDITEPVNNFCFPQTLSILYASTKFLSGANLIPFEDYLNHIVELTWDFQTKPLNKQITLSQNMGIYKLKNLKTLKLIGNSIENQDILRRVFDINSQITTLSIEIKPEEVYHFISVLKDIRYLEFLNINYFHPFSPDQSSGYDINIVLNYIVCRRLPCLQVFSINALPGQINLQNLINDIAYNCFKYTKNLKKIYLYGQIKKHQDNDPMTLFLTTEISQTTAILNKTFFKAAVTLSDFMDFNYLSLQGNGIDCEYTLRVEIDVTKLKKILTKQKAAYFGR